MQFNTPLSLQDKEIYHYFEKFHARNFFYQQVSLMHGGGITPNFYRFKI